MAAPTPGTESYSYYVNPSGSNTSPYDTPAKGAPSWLTVRDLIVSTRLAADTKCVYVLPGTTTYMYVSDAKLSNMTVVGCTAAGVPSEAQRDNVIFSDATHAPFYNYGPATDIMVMNVTLKTNTSLVYLVAGAHNMDFEYCVLDASTGNVHAFDVEGAIDGLTINRCIIYMNDATNKRGFYTTASAVNGTVSYTMIMPGKNMRYGSNAIFSQTSGTLNFYNCILSGTQGDVVYHAGSGTLNVKNSVVGGCISGGYCIEQAAGTVNAVNNLLLATIYNPTQYLHGTITDTNNIKGSDPLFTSLQSGRTAYVLLSVDDSASFTAAQNLSTALTAYGLKGTYNIDLYTWNPTNNAALRTMMSVGNLEIGSHSWSHSNLGQTTGGIITYSGGGTSPTYAIDLTNHQFTVDTADHTDQWVVTLASDNSDTIASVIATIRANTSNHWNYTPDTEVSVNIKCSSLTAVGATAIATHLALDVTGYTSGYFKNEIADTKGLIETIINGAGNLTDPQTGATYVCNTFSSPFNTFSLGAMAAVKDSGFTSFRSSAQYYAVGPKVYLYDAIAPIALSDLIGSNDADTKTRVRNMVLGAAMTGTFVSIYAHTDTVAAWTPVLDQLKVLSDEGIVIVTSQQLAAIALENSPWSYDSGTGIATRTYTGYPDYTLTTSSPCQKAGVSVGLTTDYYGGTVHSTPNIGLDDSQSPLIGGVAVTAVGGVGFTAVGGVTV